MIFQVAICKNLVRFLFSSNSSLSTTGELEDLEIKQRRLNSFFTLFKTVLRTYFEINFKTHFLLSNSIRNINSVMIHIQQVSKSAFLGELARCLYTQRNASKTYILFLSLSLVFQTNYCFLWPVTRPGVSGTLKTLPSVKQIGA